MSSLGKRKRKLKDDSAPGPIQLPPLPGLPPIPPPAGANPLPLPPVENPPPSDLSPLPLPEITPVEEEKSDDYEELWAKRSEKPLQQIYGHIERIGTGEVGSLLERYSDRFGHELDRDIIIMRKQEREDGLAEIRDAPTVKVIGEEDEVQPDDSQGTDLASELKMVEDELRRLKPEYETAKAEKDTERLSELKPILADLISMRKELKSMQSGEQELPEPVQDDTSEQEHEETEEEQIDQSSDDSEDSGDDRFPELVAVVDDLLGSHLPESVIEDFMASDDFDIYRSVGSDPESSTEEQRKNFFSVVDSRLGEMPDDAISNFVNSENFALYKEMGEMYS